MIESECLEDISKYKTKIVLGMNKRQLLCWTGAFLLGIPLYNFLGQYFIQSFCMIVSALAATPIVLCGSWYIYEMPVERYAFSVLKGFVFSPPARKYKSKNEYESLFESATDNLKYPKEEQKKINKEAKHLKKTKCTDPDLVPLCPANKKKR